MTKSTFPRPARLIAIVAVVAVAVPLIARDQASGFHREAWVAPLLDRDAYTLNVARGDGYLAWTESTVVCCTHEFAYAPGAGFVQPEHARTFKAMLRTPGGEIVQLNPDGVWASVGGIDRGVLAYATGRSQSDIRLLDLRTRERLKLPRGVNTRLVEYDPTISGKWLLFGRIRPHDRDYLKTDTEVVLTNLRTGRSRVLASGTDYRSYAWPGQVNGDWLTFTACRSNDRGPGCGVTRYRISTGQRWSPNLNGFCCKHGDPETENDGGAAPSRGVTASAITAQGVVYVAMYSTQNTSWCAYSEVWMWDRKGRPAYMFGEKEDEPRYDEGYAGLVVKSIYVDGGKPHRLVFEGHTTHEDHGYDCDVETSALYEMRRGDVPPTQSPLPTPSPSPSATEPVMATPAASETPTPSPTPAASPTPSPTASPTPSPSPSCLLPVCL